MLRKEITQDQEHHGKCPLKDNDDGTPPSNGVDNSDGRNDTRTGKELLLSLVVEINASLKL